MFKAILISLAAFALCWSVVYEGGSVGEAPLRTFLMQGGGRGRHVDVLIQLPTFVAALVLVRRTRMYFGVGETIVSALVVFLASVTATFAGAAWCYALYDLTREWSLFPRGYGWPYFGWTGACALQGFGGSLMGYGVAINQIADRAKAEGEDPEEVLLIADHEGCRVEIQRATGNRCFVWRFVPESDRSTHVYLLDDVPMAKQVASRRFGVPERAWRAVASQQESRLRTANRFPLQ